MSSHPTSPLAVPLLLKYSEKIEPIDDSGIFRYNVMKQVSETLINNEWVDAVDVDFIAEISATRVTLVRRETTDDQ